MKITIYKCDLCKKESPDAKMLYSPKSGPAMALVTMLKERFKIEDSCVECFNSFNYAVAEAVEKLKVVDQQ